MNFQFWIIIIAGFLAALILFSIFQSPQDFPYGMQDYDGLTSDLITREFGIDFIKHDEKPKNLCFALETQDGQFYRELETALQNADVSKNKFPEEIDGKFSHMAEYSK